MESKKHFKLYKSGKKWCCMALTTAAAVIGVAAAHQTVQADVTSTSTSDVQQAVVNNNADATNANEVTADSRNFSDASANINNEATDNKTVTESNNNQTSNSLESVKTTEKSITTNYNVNINDQYGNESTYSSTEKNGWVQENGQEVYYQNGKTTAGQDYIYVESMDNPSTKNWYMVKDGVAQSGLQKWYGTYYYFNPTTYLKETNAYINVKWANGDVTPYMFDNTGAIVQGLYQQNGTYYYYNPSTYLRETNTYQQVTWANGKTTWYMFGNDGRIVTGLYKWYGKYYYFNPSTYEKETNAYIPVTWANGKTTWYMFDNTGSIITGLYKWYGKYYYFDPSTYEKVTNVYIPVTWSNGKTTWYMFDDTGAMVTGLKEWYGSLYYFSPSTYEKVTNDVVYTGGSVYWANETGSLTRANSSNEAFLYSIKKAAEDGWRQYGILPSVTAAQAIIESGWGRSGLATQGHNLFGIKGSYNGQSITMRTAEYGSGGYYYINAPFRKYPSNYESVVDHGRFLAVNSRYSNLRWDTNYASVTAKLQADGYATSPTYASTLNNTIRRYGLNSWDREVIS